MDKNEVVKLTNEEMDELLAWIKGGKSLKQIGRMINKKFKGEKNEDEEGPQQAVLKVTKQSGINYEKLANAIASKEPLITMSVECAIDENKKITVGGIEPLNKRDWAAAHSDLYLRLLTSLENIISLSK